MKVFTTLIPPPKCGDVQKYQRPKLHISLSNTCIRIILKAVCNWPLEVIKHLVSPYQRGFIQGRRIYQNNLRFSTNLGMLKQAESRAADGKVILVVDFNKAHIEPQRNIPKKNKKPNNAVSSNFSQTHKFMMLPAVSISPQ